MKYSASSVQESRIDGYCSIWRRLVKDVAGNSKADEEQNV